jgi:hypothetical protein
MAVALAALLIGGTASGIVSKAVITDPKICTYDLYRYRIGVSKVLPDKKKKTKSGTRAKVSLSARIIPEDIVSIYIKDTDGKRVSDGNAVKFSNTAAKKEKTIPYKTGKGISGHRYSPVVMLQIGSKSSYLDLKVSFTP